MTRYSIKESLIKLCINNSLCNDCTNSQYEKMLNLAAETIFVNWDDPDAESGIVNELTDIIFILTHNADAYNILNIVEAWYKSIVSKCKQDEFYNAFMEV